MDQVVAVLATTRKPRVGIKAALAAVVGAVIAFVDVCGAKNKIKLNKTHGKIVIESTKRRGCVFEFVSQQNQRWIKITRLHVSSAIIVKFSRGKPHSNRIKKTNTKSFACKSKTIFIILRADNRKQQKEPKFQPWEPRPYSSLLLARSKIRLPILYC